LIYFSQRQIVVPGFVLAEGNYETGRNVYKEGNKFYATVIGLAELKDKIINVIPLRGCYIPSVGDVLIGKVIDIITTAWLVDIRSPWNAILFAKDFFSKPIDIMKEDLRKYLDVGELIVAKIISFDRTKNPVLTAKGRGLGKIEKGTVIEVEPTRVPRIIGKKGSMINMLKKETGCQIHVGQNGRIWISGKNREDEFLVVEAIRKIESEAHTTGLTNRVYSLITKRRVVNGKEKANI
jgi:exosome complex component RRP4